MSRVVSKSTRKAVEENRESLETLAQSDLRSAKYAQRLLELVDDRTKPQTTDNTQTNTENTDSLLAY